MRKSILLFVATVVAPLALAQDVSIESEVVTISGKELSGQSTLTASSENAKNIPVKMCARIRTNDDGGFNGYVTLKASRAIVLHCNGTPVQQTYVTGTNTVLLGMGSGAMKKICALGELDINAHQKLIGDDCQMTIHGGPVNTEVHGIDRSNMTVRSLNTKLRI